MEKFRVLAAQKKVLHIVFVILIVSLSYVLFKIMTNIYITIQFDELAPFENNMPVYYKGFKVGYTRSIKPSKDFKHTLIKVTLDYKDLQLPKNTTAIVNTIDKGEKEGKFDYIELKYPDSPSIYFLKTGSVIKGKTLLNWDTLIAQQAEKGTLDDIGGGVNDLLESLKETSDSLNSIFTTLNEILAENRTNINKATKNISDTTSNLKDVSNKVNNAMSQDSLNDTTAGLGGSSINVEQATENLKEITQNLNQMMPYIDATIMDVNSTICNVNQISAGVLETLQKRLGLMKLLIGKPISKEKCCP